MIFHGDESHIKATSPPGEWVKFLNFDPWLQYDHETTMSGVGFAVI